MTFTRRSAVKCLAGAMMVPTAATTAATADALRPTPQETLGPYFPVRTPPDHSFDLTHVAGRAGRAKGQTIELSGLVLRVDGSPVPNARIEIWQANAAGRYTNPVDKNPAPLDLNFKGVALLRADAHGAYRIRTIKPGPYPDPAGGMRTPHIHFDVTAHDYRLVTQMYFPGEPLNEKDILIATMAGRARDVALATCKVIEGPAAGILGYRWDIVLLQA
jgi:protocatechuate 3,4-dioxygenase beta subunit